MKKLKILAGSNFNSVLILIAGLLLVSFSFIVYRIYETYETEDVKKHNDIAELLVRMMVFGLFVSVLALLRMILKNTAFIVASIIASLVFSVISANAANLPIWDERD